MISIREKWSTSTKSSRYYTALLLIWRERLTLEIQRLALQKLKQSRKLKWALSGLLHGNPLRERLLLSSNTENGNCQNMETILRGSLRQRGHRPMARSSFSTEASGMRLEEGNCCYSQTMPTLPPCMLPCCKMMEWSITKERGLEGVKEEVAVEARSQRFNSQAGCHFSETGCKYLHSCQSCGKAGHGKHVHGKWGWAVWDEAKVLFAL